MDRAEGGPLVRPMKDESFLCNAKLAVRWGACGLLLILVLLVTLGATIPDLNKAGKAAYARGDFAEAERLFRQAIARAPEEPLLHYHRAVALMRLHRWREASEAYQAILRLDAPPAIAAAAREGLRTLEPLTRAPTRRATPPGEARIPLQRSRGAWFTEVVLNATQKARFLVDTGASVCVIAPKLAGVLGLKPGRRALSVTLETLAGPTTGPLVTLRSVRVGQAEVKKVSAVIHKLGPEMDGILGNSFLSHYRVTLDPKRGVLLLGPR